MSARGRKRLFGLCMLVLLAPQTATACPNCKDAVAEGAGETERLQHGYSSSILLMIGMPVALAGAGGLMIARAIRRGEFPEL